MIQPIATTRVTNSITRDRITQQIQLEQNELFRLQNQLSTGLRFFLPSEDPSSAQRALALQRTIERKDQSLTNLEGTRNALSISDSSLSEVADTINQITSSTLNVIGTISSEDERNAVIELIDQAIFKLTGVGNTEFAGSYLFSGGESSGEPYVNDSGYIEYRGGESSPQTFVDLGFLFDTAAAGDNVLGGLSEAVRGIADLNLQASPSTSLAQLNGGRGISSNPSIEVVFESSTPGVPVTTSTVDLSSASTLSDVARLIEASAPAGADIYARVSGQGLTVSTTGGDLLIREVAGGNTAAELGLLTVGGAQPTLVGSDLDPVLLTTSRLDEVVGVKSRGRLEIPGTNNDVIIEATANGSSFNNLTIDIVDGATAGSESASYNPGTNTLTVTIADGQTTAAQLAAAINTEGTFVAETDYRDASSAAAEGSGQTPAGTYTGVTDTAGVDGDIDLASGLRITNGADEYVVDTSAAETVEDLLNLLNDEAFGLAATINDAGTGIDVRTRRSGADFTIGENGGSTASDLGIRTYTTDTRLEDFNRGQGVILSQSANELTIELTDAGVTNTYNIDLTNAVTVADVITEVATQTGGELTASLATTGNGLVFAGTQGVVAISQASGNLTVAGQTISLTAVAGQSADGAEGNQAANLDITFGAGPATSYDASTNTLSVSVAQAAGVATLNDVIAAINGTGTQFTATLGGANGAQVINTGDDAAASFSLSGGLNNSAAGADSITISGSVAEQLGFVSDPGGSVTSTTGSVASDDRHTLEVDSLFNSLIRLRTALNNNDEGAVSAELERLDDDHTRVTFGIAEIGARVQNLDAIESRLRSEEADLRGALSTEIDADLVEVISDITAQQFALQAALQTSGQILQLSLLDFI